ncbi:MAG: hypothetical protein INH41_27845 [Myxococcaceae bacterium]|jgi:hypothetical protein|nr:hypothetical protein [Myxococcaceae bacterium]MCA3016215.1 hypothetical protein [Myxococcaceae bacterium]
MRSPSSSQPAPGSAAPRATPGTTAPGSAADGSALWRAAVEAVRADSPRHGKSLSFGRFVGLDASTVKLAFPADAGFHRTTVFGMSRQLIEAALSRHFGRPMRVAEETGAQALTGTAPSIAEEEARETAARHSAIDARVAQHPAIRNVLRILGGTVEHVQYLEPVREAPTLVPASTGPDED